MKLTRLFAYVRVSHEEQKKYGFSIKAQIDRIEFYAKQNNCIIIDIFIDDGYSAGTTKRPELQRMLTCLHKADQIVFTRLDRFSRNVLDANEMVQLFNRVGISIKAIDEPDIDTSTADGKFNFDLRVSLAERELAKGSERIKTVFDYKVKNGHAITGTQPYGYKVKNINGEKRVVKDEEVSHIVDEIFAYFLKSHSIRGTMYYINKKYNIDLSYRGYGRIFKNPFYAGIYKYNRNYCEPYITFEQYESNRNIIKKNITIRKNSHTYLFTGLLICPNCGSKLTGVKFPKPKKTYYNYRCNVKYQKKQCDFGFVPNEDTIEKFLLQNINEMAEQYVYNASIEVEDNRPKIDIKSITNEMDRLNTLFVKGRIDEVKYDERYMLLEERLKEVQNELPQIKDISGIEAFLSSDWQKVYELMPREDKRALFRSVIDKIYIDEKGGVSRVEFV